MNKPDWDDAPEWANYVAQDHDNTWWWYEKEPEYDGHGAWNMDTGDVTIVILPIDVTDTLGERPHEHQDK